MEQPSRFLGWRQNRLGKRSLSAAGLSEMFDIDAVPCSVPNNHRSSCISRAKHSSATMDASHTMLKSLSQQQLQTTRMAGVVSLMLTCPVHPIPMTTGLS